MKLVLEQKTKVCEIRSHLPAQVTEVKLLTENADIRSLVARDLREKVNESDNLSHVQKVNLFRMLSKYRAHFMPKPGLCELLEYELAVLCSEPLLAIHDQYHFQPDQLSENK
jgi:hypothetical protein